jgi:hypothetical protein
MESQESFLHLNFNTIILAQIIYICIYNLNEIIFKERLVLSMFFTFIFNIPLDS